MPFAAPLRTALAGVAEGDGVEVAAPLLCETTRQLPNPDVVVKDTRQRSLPVPPVQLVPAGSWALSCCWELFLGF